jgi:hypothetical protein
VALAALFLGVASAAGAFPGRDGAVAVFDGRALVFASAAVVVLELRAIAGEAVARSVGLGCTG